MSEFGGSAINLVEALVLNVLELSGNVHVLL